MVRATHAQMRDHLQTLQTPRNMRTALMRYRQTRKPSKPNGGNVPPSKQSRDCMQHLRSLWG